MHWITAELNMWAEVTIVYLDKFQKGSEYEFWGSSVTSQHHGNS